MLPPTSPPPHPATSIELILVSGIDPLAKIGGHESYVVAHALAARAAGFSPHVFCVGAHAARLETEFGTLHRIASPVRPFRGFMVAGHRPFLATGIRRHLRGRPGTVLLHGFGVWGFVAAGVARSLRRQNRRAVSVASAYTTMKHEYREKLAGLHRDHGAGQHARHWREYILVRLLGVPCERRGYAAQPLVLVNYQAVHDRLLADYHLTVEIRRLPYAAPAAFHDAPCRPQPPATLPRELAALQPPDATAAPLIVSISRHDPRKGLDVLLRALARLDADGAPFRACLLSGGPLLPAHRALAVRLGLSSRVTLTGQVDDPGAFLRQAAIFVLPSIQEGSGSLSVLEAMQAACAIVSSRCDGLPEDLADGDNALLVAPGDDAALAAALGRLLGDPELRRRLGRRARATFEQRFSAPAFAAALRATYEELTAGL
jgi:glycosyltransferase involved in cell wall biosynthesis